jgi:hypothetical protein
MTDDVEMRRDPDPMTFRPMPPPVVEITEPPVPIMHASIIAAVAKIMRGAHTVEMSGENKFAGYKHATVDDVYAACQKHCAEAGLVIMPLQAKAADKKVHETQKGPRTTATFYFTFLLATEEATWHDARNLYEVPIELTGPQSAQAAVSYATKSFMKSLFKLVTGEKDVDDIVDNRTAAEKGEPVEPAKKAGRKKGTKTLDKAASEKARMTVCKALVDKVQKGKRPLTPEEVGEWAEKYADILGALSDVDRGKANAAVQFSQTKDLSAQMIEEMRRLAGIE